MTVTAEGPTVVSLPRRSFVLVAGIPGAGKSTLLAARPLPGASVLDSDPPRRWLRARLPQGTPYRRYRFLVHLVHRLRIVAALLAAVGPVVVHLPATGVLTRVALVVLAALACRRRYLVWVHADAGQARAGQARAGLVLDTG